MGIHRSALRRRRREDAADTKARNAVCKTAERERRDARMVAKLRSGSLPYTPTVMSWMSRKLKLKSGDITPEHVKTLIT